VEYKRILAALDRSPQTDAVFAQALELAKKEVDIDVVSLPAV
jgi:nucleotide-binding universal stress UspA family protein